MRPLPRAARQWRMDRCARLYGEGKLTLARAAREAGASPWEMMSHARSNKRRPNTTWRIARRT